MWRIHGRRVGDPWVTAADSALHAGRGGAAPQPTREETMKRSFGAGLAAAAVLALAGCNWSGTAAPSESSSASSSAPASAHRERPQPDARTLQRLGSFAFNAFVVPVLDDGEVTRFSDPRVAPLCGEDSEVRVNGHPLQPGAHVPPGAFELAWDMRMFCPFGPDSVALDGTARVLVFRDDEHGMEALVLPQALTASDERGAVALTARTTQLSSTQWRTGQPVAAREE